MVMSQQKIALWYRKYQANSRYTVWLSLGHLLHDCSIARLAVLMYTFTKVVPDYLRDNLALRTVQ